MILIFDRDYYINISLFIKKRFFENFYFELIYYILKIDNYEIDKYIEERNQNSIIEC